MSELILFINEVSERRLSFYGDFSYQLTNKMMSALPWYYKYDDYSYSSKNTNIEVGLAKFAIERTVCGEYHTLHYLGKLEKEDFLKPNNLSIILKLLMDNNFNASNILNLLLSHGLSNNDILKITFNKDNGFPIHDTLNMMLKNGSNTQHILNILTHNGFNKDEILKILLDNLKLSIDNGFNTTEVLNILS